VHVELSLSTSSPIISLSESTSKPTQAIVTARIIESVDSSSPITLQVDGNPLDGGHDSFHDAPFRGALSTLEDITDKSRRIILNPPVRVNYGSNHDKDLRKVTFMHFATIPAKGQGVLMVKYNLTLERLFKFQDYPGTLKREDVKPGDKFQLRMSNVNMIGWWAFGDLQGDLKEKKFVGDWETPNADGKFDTLVEGEKSNVEMMKQDGWVFSEKRQDLNMTTDTDEGVVIEFVE